MVSTRITILQCPSGSPAYSRGGLAALRTRKNSRTLNSFPVRMLEKIIVPRPAIQAQRQRPKSSELISFLLMKQKAARPKSGRFTVNGRYKGIPYNGDMVL